MAIVARVPFGFPIASATAWSTQTVGIESDTALAAGDILLAFCTSEGTSTGSPGVLPDPITITGITTTLNGGLHPASFTISNLLDPSGTDLSSDSGSRWLDLGYTAGGYDAGGSPGRNHGGVWAKVLTDDDIFGSGIQVSVTFTLDQVRNAAGRLMVVSGASTEEADLATLINIARSSMGNTRSTSGTDYDEAEWWGPNATGQVTGDPESNHHLGTTAVESSSVEFIASSGQISFAGASDFNIGAVISVSGSDGGDNDGLYVITGTTATILFTSPMGGSAAVTDESAGETITITSGGYSTGDLGDDFLAMFFTSTPPETLPAPTAAPVGTGTVRPPSVQAAHVADTVDWNVDGTYPAGWAAGFNRTTPPAHAFSCYWDRQESFATFHGLWDGTTNNSLNPNRFAWDYDDVDSQSGTNQLWAYNTHLLLLKQEAGAVAGTPVTATGSYAVTSTGSPSTATGSYAVKTTGTPVTATGSYAVTSTGSPTTATGAYEVTSTGAVTATGSYAVTSTGTVATATGAYAVSTTGLAVTATGSYAVVSAGTIATATGSYAVTSAGTATTATGVYAVTSTGAATTATGSYAIPLTGSPVTSTGSYAVTSTGTATTSTGSYAVTSTGTAVTATGSYDVDSTTSGSTSATGSYVVTSVGTAVTATGSYAISLTGSLATAAGSYAVTSTGTAATSTGSYVVTSSASSPLTGSYAVITAGTAATATGSYGITLGSSSVTVTCSYVVTGVTYGPTPAELYCKYAVINEAHLGYKAFRQLSTLRQKVK